MAPDSKPVAQDDVFTQPESVLIAGTDLDVLANDTLSADGGNRISAVEFIDANGNALGTTYTIGTATYSIAVNGSGQSLRLKASGEDGNTVPDTMRVRYTLQDADGDTSTAIATINQTDDVAPPPPVNSVPIARDDTYAISELMLIRGSPLDVLANDTLSANGGNRIVSAVFVDTNGTSKMVHSANYTVLISANGQSLSLHANNGDYDLFARNDVMQIRYVLEDADGDRSTAIATVTQMDDTTPLVLDLDGDGAETLHVDAGVRFDMGSDGKLDKTGWVAPDDGLLVLDWNGNGMIDNQSELFGTDVTDGFTILSQLDGNADGRMDSADERWSGLQVWQDANSDGVSQAGEMKSLAELGITSIDLNASEISEVNNGNFISHESTFTYADGRTGEIVDAWFRLDDDGVLAMADGGGVALDATAIAQYGMTNVEVIDITAKGSGNSLTLTAADVLDMSDTGTVRIDADGTDTVDIKGFAKEGAQVIGGNPYDTYTSGGATILIDQATGNVIV